MIRSVSLFILLFLLWLLLSGFFQPLLIGLGLASCLLVTWIAWRMDVVDHEGHPIHLTWWAVLYWPWLAWEIVKSNVGVARLILDPKLPISPSVIEVKATQPDELGHVIFANSITLTPGTVSIDLTDSQVKVHSLAKIFAEGLQSGEMDRRVTRMEGPA